MPSIDFGNDSAFYAWQQIKTILKDSKIWPFIRPILRNSTRKRREYDLQEVLGSCDQLLVLLQIRSLPFGASPKAILSNGNADDPEEKSDSLENLKRSELYSPRKAAELKSTASHVVTLRFLDQKERFLQILLEHKTSCIGAVVERPLDFQQRVGPLKAGITTTKKNVSQTSVSQEDISVEVLSVESARQDLSLLPESSSPAIDPMHPCATSDKLIDREHCRAQSLGAGKSLVGTGIAAVRERCLSQPAQASSGADNEITNQPQPFIMCEDIYQRDGHRSQARVEPVNVPLQKQAISSSDVGQLIDDPQSTSFTNFHAQSTAASPDTPSEIAPSNSATGVNLIDWQAAKNTLLMPSYGNLAEAERAAQASTQHRRQQLREVPYRPRDRVRMKRSLVETCTLCSRDMLYWVVGAKDRNPYCYNCAKRRGRILLPPEHRAGHRHSLSVSTNGGSFMQEARSASEPNSASGHLRPDASTDVSMSELERDGSEIERLVASLTSAKDKAQTPVMGAPITPTSVLPSGRKRSMPAFRSHSSKSHKIRKIDLGLQPQTSKTGPANDQAPRWSLQQELPRDANHQPEESEADMDQFSCQLRSTRNWRESPLLSGDKGGNLGNRLQDFPWLRNPCRCESEQVVRDDRHRANDTCANRAAFGKTPLGQCVLENVLRESDVDAGQELNVLSKVELNLRKLRKRSMTADDRDIVLHVIHSFLHRMSLLHDIPVGRLSGITFYLELKAELTVDADLRGRWQAVQKDYEELVNV